MGVNAKIVARTVEDTSGNTKQMIADFLLISGKAAGVCYAPDDYLTCGINNNEAAMKRVKGCISRNHTSILAHCYFTLQLELSKMMAMVINSTSCYSTSEKSARYTRMKPKTEKEREKYEYWTKKLREIILDKYPFIDDKFIKTQIKKAFAYDKVVVQNGNAMIISEDTRLDNHIEAESLARFVEDVKKSEDAPSNKLATENARYMISVFTPTFMLYTVSYRQATLLVHYLERLGRDCENSDNDIYKTIGKEAIELAKVIREQIGEVLFNDTKNQKIRFLGNCSSENYVNKREYLGDSFTLRYKTSLACAAHLERHRSLRHSIVIPKVEDFEFYVPEIVKAYGLEEQWLADIKEVSYCVPQGVLVDVTEQGIFEDFALKCKERLCGFAQKEICDLTAENLKKFADDAVIDNLCDENKELLLSMLSEVTDDKQVVPRCMFTDYNCTGACVWGPKGALDRLV